MPTISLCLDVAHPFLFSRSAITRRTKKAVRVQQFFPHSKKENTRGRRGYHLSRRLADLAYSLSWPQMLQTCRNASNNKGTAFFSYILWNKKTKGDRGYLPLSPRAWHTLAILFDDLRCYRSVESRRTTKAQQFRSVILSIFLGNSIDKMKKLLLSPLLQSDIDHSLLQPQMLQECLNASNKECITFYFRYSINFLAYSINYKTR